MTKQKSVYQMSLAGVLCAIGIIIPLFSPIRVTLDPMSFTLASHLAIFLAMFISPPVAAAVSLGTALGFFLSSSPIGIVLRALSHVVFASIGAVYLRKHPDIVNFKKPNKRRFRNLAVFGLWTSLLHSLCEMIIVIPFYRATLSGDELVRVVILLVGVGTLVHSLVDFALSLLIWKPVQSAVS